MLGSRADESSLIAINSNHISTSHNMKELNVYRQQPYVPVYFRGKEEIVRIEDVHVTARTMRVLVFEILQF